MDDKEKSLGINPICVKILRKRECFSCFLTWMTFQTPRIQLFYSFMNIIFYLTDPNKTETIERGCSSDHIEGTDVCDYWLSKEKETQCYACQKDLCNAATEIYLHTWMFLFSLVFAFVLRHHAYGEWNLELIGLRQNNLLYFCCF